jgi:multimeric flavodoxin WrbA
MRVLAIHGSPRSVRSQTRKVADWVLSGAREAGAETELVDLADLQIVPCTACESCSLDGTCVHADDVADLFARMLDADALVLASPVYVDNVTGQMKVFIDRLADAMHYQTLAGKYGAAVATTFVSGGDDVVAYLNHVLNYLGIVSAGGLSVAHGGDPEAIEGAEAAARDLGERLADAVRTGQRYPGQEAVIAENREFFKDIVVENRDWRPGEYDRWVREGWIRE